MGAETNLSSCRIKVSLQYGTSWNSKKSNAGIFINPELDGSENSMPSGYVFYTLGSDNDNENSNSIQANVAGGCLKKDRSLNAEQLVRNPQKNVNRVVEAVIEGLDNRLKNIVPAPASEFLLQTKSCLTEVVCGILVAYERQISLTKLKLRS